MKNCALLILAVTLIGCVAKKAPEASAESNSPLPPIQYNGQATHVCLTDYLPQLTGDEQLTIETDWNYSVQNYTLLEFDLIGDNTAGTMIVIVDSTTQYDIPILPLATP